MHIAQPPFRGMLRFLVSSIQSSWFYGKSGFWVNLEARLACARRLPPGDNRATLPTGSSLAPPPLPCLAAFAPAIFLEYHCAAVCGSKHWRSVIISRKLVPTRKMFMTSWNGCSSVSHRYATLLLITQNRQRGEGGLSSLGGRQRLALG